MRKTILEQGISLIALIITIIILLILTVVTIGTIKNSNIIGYAQNSATGYNDEKAKEENIIAGHESTIIENTKEIQKAIVGKIVEKNSTINGEAYSSTNPIIPAGFAPINIIGENESKWDAKEGPQVNKGLVITDNIEKDARDETGNATIGSEFVWVPVANINDMIMCKVCGASKILDEKTLQCPDCKENTKLAGKLYSTTGNRFNSLTTGQKYVGNSGLREPDVVTGSSGEDSTIGTDYDYKYLSTVLETEYAEEQTVTSFKAQLQNEFNNMAKSVAKYGGFYVGRYEMSLTINKTAQSKYGEASTNQSKPDTKMWYGLYVKSKTYLSTKSSVQSTMIWGSQYDAMLRWIANGDDSRVKTDIGDKRNTTNFTGTVSTDILNNVYDLFGCKYEQTLTALGENARVNRTGYQSGHSPSLSFYTITTNSSDFNCSRLTIYII